MSIGSEWKARIETDAEEEHRAARIEAEERAEVRAAQAIEKLKRNLADRLSRDCLVMDLERNEVSVPFDKLYGQVKSSHRFRGAAKVVVEFCLENDLDVYVWEEDFKMSSGSIGGEIWVMPHGVRYPEK